MNPEIYTQVWRHDLTEPGYYWLDAGLVDSQQLRRMMVQIQEQACANALPGFTFRSMARFDQQETTRFHQDGGPPHNILILGYEPSKVRSRLFLADHHCAANDLGVPANQIMAQAMYGNDEQLKGYITELPQPEEGHSYILAINNSGWIGLLHKAEIVNPLDTEQRIVNSIMLSTEPKGLDEVAQAEFMSTDQISKKVYS